jgi:hypothetical protein
VRAVLAFLAMEVALGIAPAHPWLAACRLLTPVHLSPALMKAVDDLAEAEERRGPAESHTRSPG